jgi:hypothetical protein
MAEEEAAAPAVETAAEKETEAAAPAAAAAPADTGKRGAPDGVVAPPSKRAKKAASSSDAEKAAKAVQFTECDAAQLHAGLCAAVLVTSREKKEASAVVDATTLLLPHYPQGTRLLPLKLATRGVSLLHVLPPADAQNVDLLAAVSAAMAAAAEPLNCVRLCPLQTSCAATTDAVAAAAERLVSTHLAARADPGSLPQEAFVFAVAFHGRGLDPVLVGDQLPARQEVIRAAASGVERACAATERAHRVSLEAPDFALVVEILPTLCAKGEVCCAAFLALLPSTMLSQKPKLAVRALTT